jgi:GalNAc-alpha-(1->4)-GalNAc-alpha-(1->3)-diNAcBac-PP-undecaprenol alpha-1,4-N-acetyl-D-galactosaminyltransferase
LSNPLDPKQNSSSLRGRHILLAIHSLEGGGSERQIACLTNHLAQDSSIANVALVTVAPSDSDAYSLHPRVERISLHHGSSPPKTNNLISKLCVNLFRIRKLKKIAAQLAPDVVVSFCDMNNSLILLALGKKYPVVISERSDPRFQIMPRVWEAIRKRVYRRAKVCVAQTDDVRDFLQREFYPRKSKTRFFTIPSAIQAPGTVAHESQQQPSQKENRLLFVGRLAREKQLDQILHAWKNTHAQLPNWKLRIVGTGPLENDLKALATNLSLSDSVQWCGWTSDIWNEYRQARAFVMASRYEGFPQSLIEAMTMGLPCFVTNFSPAIGECIEHLESGFILTNPSDLSKYLTILDEDPLLEQKIRIRTRMVARRYQWATIATSWEAAIASAIP